MEPVHEYCLCRPRDTQWNQFMNIACNFLIWFLISINNKLLICENSQHEQNGSKYKCILRRVKHDTIAACLQGKVEQVYTALKLDEK